MDRILVSDLRGRCIIGVNEEERRNKQDVVINLAILTDLRKAGKSDRFEDAVDYRATKKRIVAMVESSHYYLAEALAEVELPQGRRWAAHAALEKGNPLCL